MPSPAHPERSRWSISALAREFGMDRRKISALIDGATPVGAERGQPVYALRDVAPLICEALTGTQYVGRPGQGINPDHLTNTRDYKDYWTGTEARIRAEERARRLAPAEAIEAEMRTLVAPLVALLETLPDVLERDADLTPEQAHLIRRLIDAQRERVAQQIEGL